jgi:hephaestin
MMALFNISGKLTPAASKSSSRKSREYFIQAEDVIWDYAPQKFDVCDNRPFRDDENVFVMAGRPMQDSNGTVLGYSVGSSYLKTRYFQYTDSTFSEKSSSYEREHIGIMGPVLRAQVGDELVVHFRSKSSEPVSLHAHGVSYTKSSEGAPYNDGTEGAFKKDDVLKTGESYTYRWTVTSHAGPGPGESGDSKLWMYHSHRNEILDTYAGLFGAILIVSNDSSIYNQQDLTPVDNTSEIILHFSVMNEGQSVHAVRNVQRNIKNSKLEPDQVTALLENEQFAESNMMHAINGYAYCSGPPFTAKAGDLMRVHMYSLGTEVDLHSPVFGNEVMQLDTGSSRSSGKLLPGVFFSADIHPMRTGKYELRCNVDDHIKAGMRALFEIKPSNRSVLPPTPTTNSENYTRIHYVAAEEIEWDYAESGRDKCTHEPLDDDAKVFTAPGKCRPGSKYIKAVYREYEDGFFTTRKEKAYPPDFDSLAGPLFHFEVGDIVRIEFRNKLRFAANIKIAGLELLSPNVSNKAVAPGSELTYIWRVPDSAGPSRADVSSVPYVYFSSVEPVSHVNAGLAGVIAIASIGGLESHKNHPVDIPEAYPLLFNVFRENLSPLIEDSIERYAEGDCSQTDLTGLTENEKWIESNAMHSINGFSFCNNPVIESKVGVKVRFYIFGFGSEESMHSPIFRNQLITSQVRRGDSESGVQIFPYNAESLDVLMISRGRSSFECAVADHVKAGMKGRFVVR